MEGLEHGNLKEQIVIDLTSANCLMMFDYVYITTLFLSTKNAQIE